MLAKVRQENVELRSKIAEISTEGFEQDKGTIGSLADVARLAEEAETFAAKIEVEKRNISDRDRKLRDADRDIKRVRDELTRSATDANMRKQVERLMGNLDHAAKKFATEVAENKKARSEINELRRERKRFKQIMSQHRHRMQTVERQIGDVVAESQAFLDERAEYNGRIEELQHNSDQAQEEFYAQCRELKHVIRAFDLMEEKLSKGDESFPSVGGNMTAEQEEDLQKKVVKGKWQLAKEKAMTDLLKEQALNFEEAFEKLQAATGFAKIEDFVSHFIQIEELNFHRFQYMHSLNIDIEKMEEEIRQLTEEAKRAVTENKGKDDHWQQIKVNTMERVDKITTQDEQLEANIAKTQDIIKRLDAKARAICSKVQISEQELHDDGIEDDADPMMVVCHLLGKVERKAIYLSQYAHLLRDEGEEGKRNLEAEDGNDDLEEKETGPGKETAPIYMKPRAPSVRDDEDDGDAEAPLSADFLRLQLQGKGEEMLRIALAPGDENKDGVRGEFARPGARVSRAPSKSGGGVPSPSKVGRTQSNGSMKTLNPGSSVPALNTSKLSSAGDGSGQVSNGAASSREGGRTSRVNRPAVPAGSKTTR